MQTEKNFSEINFATLKNKQVTRRMGGSEDPPPPPPHPFSEVGKDFLNF